MSWSRAWLAPCQYMRGGKCRLEYGHQVAVVSARTSFLLLENKIKNVEQDGQNLTWELHPSKYAAREPCTRFCAEGANFESSFVK